MPPQNTDPHRLRASIGIGLEYLGIDRRKALDHLGHTL
jgi:hypothetical protein